jgi:hypothetical protein
LCRNKSAVLCLSKVWINCCGGICNFFNSLQTKLEDLSCSVTLSPRVHEVEQALVAVLPS